MISFKQLEEQQWRIVELKYQLIRNNQSWLVNARKMESWLIWHEAVLKEEDHSKQREVPNSVPLWLQEPNFQFRKIALSRKYFYSSRNRTLCNYKK